ncbi:MAG: ABC transporter permease [Coriobacteriia bacterium]|nr:ABC transporter permease [Coriobacteriia bacterium]MCL2749861.1 ABC transporter permease [Coriobacteriia bacterium]
MKQLLTIITANLKGGKGQVASLLGFALISALLLNIGLLLMVGFGNFFDERSEALNAPHLTIIELEHLYADSQMQYFNDYPGVTDAEKESALMIYAKTSYGDGKMSAFLILLNEKTQRAMNDLTILEGAKPVAANEICLPFLFKAGGYELGSIFEFTVGNKDFSYRVSGFTEEIMWGSINNTIFQLYLSSAGFAALQEDMPEAAAMTIRVRLDNPDKSEALRINSVKELFFATSAEGYDYGHYFALDYNGVKMIRTMMSNITAIILVVFAALLISISLLVIRFRIRNSIEESMHNIGALKAVGYTGKQLLWAHVLQFSIIALVGIVLGIGLSYALLPVVSGVLEQQTALQWQQGFDLGLSALAFISILLAVAVVTWLSARRIQKLQPLTALRQGLSTHNFKRNHFSLDSSRGALTWLLAVKSALHAKGQMVMIALIVTMVSFAAAAGVAVYDNLGVNSGHFARILSGEMPDAAATARTPEEAQVVYRVLEQDAKVRKVFYKEDVSVMIGDLSVVSILAEDYRQFEGEMLYEGQYPRHANEIAIGGSLARYYNLEIGDSVKAVRGSSSSEYLITGFIQLVNNGGITCALTIEGYRQLQSDYKPSSVFIYLVNSEETAALLADLEKTHGKSLESTLNIKELADAQLSMYGSIFFAVAVVLVAATALVIVLVLFLMMKTVILRQRRSLGIQKALGFTSFQLMNQLALYFFPVIVLGITLGGILGALSFNPIFVALTQNMGIMSASMPAPIGPTIATCVGLAVLAYVVAMLIALRIRKISAYALVTE